MKLSDWVLTARKHKGWTQEKLGDQLNLTKGNISAWEKGRHEPSYDRLTAISAMTGYPMPAAVAAGAEPGTSMSFGQHAMLLARSLIGIPDADRDLIAQQVAHLLRHGPAEHIAKALDAIAAVSVVIPPMGEGDFVSPSEPVELPSPRAERATEPHIAPGPRFGGEQPWDSKPASPERSVSAPKGDPGSQPIHRLPGLSTQRKRSSK